MSLEWLDWEDEPEDATGSEWDLYYVGAYDIVTGAAITKGWPVLAQGYSEAMDVYQLLLKLSK